MWADATQSRSLASESRSSKARHSKGGIGSGTYVLDIISTETVTRDGMTIPSPPYRIRLTVQLNFLAELIKENRLAAQARLADVETDLQFVIQEINQWKHRLKIAEQEGYLISQHPCGLDWQFLFESNACYASQEAAWDKGRELLQLLFHGRVLHASQTGATRRVR